MVNNAHSRSINVRKMKCMVVSSSTVYRCRMRNGTTPKMSKPGLSRRGVFLTRQTRGKCVVVRAAQVKLGKGTLASFFARTDKAQ